MKHAVLIAGFLAAVAATDWWAARLSPPTGVSGWAQAATPAAAAREDAAAQAKLDELEEILGSKNDNDPRLDRDFDGLSLKTKRLFRRRYREIPAEKRNARGTIVYLLGRNLRAAEDWLFFRQVVLEPPCLSLSDCAKKPAPGSDEEETGDEVTLAYPALVALRQAGAALEKSRAASAAVQHPADATTEKAALHLFEAAQKSKTRAVARTAESFEKRFSLPERP